MSGSVSVLGMALGVPPIGGEFVLISPAPGSVLFVGLQATVIALTPAPTAPLFTVIVAPDLL